jgi:lysophospholipase L1-like esterase
MVTGSPFAEPDDRYCLRDGEAERLLSGHPWRRFAVVGDSIAEGLGDRVDGYPDQSWTDRVAAELGRQQTAFTHLNLGRRDTGAARVRATQLDPALAFAPDLALVACGGYDSLRPAYDPAGVDAEMRAIVGALRERGCAVVTVSMFDGSRNPAVPERYRGWLRQRLATMAENTRRLATDLGTIHIDLFGHPASGENIYSGDGRHGNRRGHAIAAAETVRGLGAHLTGGGTGDAD